MTVAEFTVAAGDFPLGSAFVDLAGVRIELEKIVPIGDRVVPYLWVRAVDVGDMERALEAHRATQRVTVVETIEDRHLLRVDWNPAYTSFLDVLVEVDVVLLSAGGTDDTWQFTVRGDTRESISALESACRAVGIPIELTHLTDRPSVDADDAFGLTDAQREALRLAYERGYFDSPRATSLEAVATELDISRQALADRLQRGHRRLLENTIV